MAKFGKKPRKVDCIKTSISFTTIITITKDPNLQDHQGEQSHGEAGTKRGDGEKTGFPPQTTGHRGQEQRDC